MSEKPNLEQMLKLWSKKDLWNRIQEKNKQISDLEAKLAESEEINKLLNKQLKDMERSKLSWENQYFTLYKTLKNYREVSEKQLAEKEKEIENIKLCKCVNCTNEYEFMLEGLVEDLEKQIDRDEQDKISLCIEQLEKVIEYIDNHKCKTITDDRYVVYRKSLVDTIYNQIKQLKEGK